MLCTNPAELGDGNGRLDAIYRGPHLVDANVALGDLVDLVAEQADGWLEANRG